MQLIELVMPHGGEWHLLAAVLVIIFGPILAERARLPGMIGLLIGGWLIGANGLGIVPDGSGIVAELGTVGLLYLMFLAGLELDLGVFVRYRMRAVVLAVMTFALPLGIGAAAGIALGYSTAAAVLLGSLFASHTLVTYPLVKRMGLAANPAVAVAVGATIVTDTLALMVLAVVAGSTIGSGTGAELVLQLAIGLGALLLWCFVVLPPLTRWFFTTLGQQRVLRYVYLVAALLASAVLAEMVGIEGIVGAFFAGLALNKFVPNESPFMERVEFFGAALFIPMFLVSVGTIIDPAVVFDPRTLALASIFIAACFSGKFLAALACIPMFRFTWHESQVVFALTTPQAAATLAATFVGLQIGLFTVTVVNAVMVLIVASLMVSSVMAERYGRLIPTPPVDHSRLGRAVVLHVPATNCGPIAGIAARLAASDSGVVFPTVVVADGEDAPQAAELEAFEEQISALGIDVEIDLRVDTSVADGIVHAAASHHASLIVAPAGEELWLPTLLGSPMHPMITAAQVPVLLVRPGEGPVEGNGWKRVVLALGQAQLSAPGPATELAIEVAGRLASSGLELTVVSPDRARAQEILAQVPSVHVREWIQSTRAIWIRNACGSDDVVVVPGGRNGAIDTARTTKNSARVGATVVSVADRRSAMSRSGARARTGLVGWRSG